MTPEKEQEYRDIATDAVRQAHAVIGVDVHERHEGVGFILEALEDEFDHKERAANGVHPDHGRPTPDNGPRPAANPGPRLEPNPTR